MILAVSTSGPTVSVGAWSSGAWLWTEERAADRNSSAAVAQILVERGVLVMECEGFLCDIGPGSFSGVKAGVTMAKLWAHLAGKPVWAVTSFDLIDPNGPVAVASKRGEVFYRAPDEEAVSRKIDELEPRVRGYFSGVALVEEPKFGRMGFDELPKTEVEAAALVPLYVAPPSISLPKQKLIMGEAFEGDA